MYLGKVMEGGGYCIHCVAIRKPLCNRPPPAATLSTGMPCVFLQGSGGNEEPMDVKLGGLLNK